MGICFGVGVALNDGIVPRHKFLANVPSEVPRSAGAADAREAEKASAVTARRG